MTNALDSVTSSAASVVVNVPVQPPVSSSSSSSGGPSDWFFGALAALAIARKALNRGNPADKGI